MNWIAFETEIRMVGGLAVLFTLYSVWMGQMSARGLPDGYRNPVLALELVKNGEDIKRIVSAEDGKAREFIRRSTYKDFGFIFVYALFFVALSLLLSRMDSSWAKFVGWSAAACALLAAILDLIEDRGMLKAIAGEASDSLADSIRYPSLAKWSLLFVFCLLIGMLLLARREVFVISAIFFIVAALTGLYGVFLNLFRPRFYLTFPAALICLGVGVIILAVAFAFWPNKLLNTFAR